MAYKSFKGMTTKQIDTRLDKYHEDIESLMMECTRFCLGHTYLTIPAIKKNFDTSIGNTVGWIGSEMQQDLVNPKEESEE